MQNIKKYLTKDHIIFLGLVFVVLAEVFALIPFSAKRAILLSKKNKTNKTKIVSIKNEWPRKDKYLSTKAGLEKTIATEKNRVIYVTEAETLISYISVCARDSNVEIEEVIPIDGISVDLKVKGKYHNIGQFFDLLQNKKYLLKIEKVVITADVPVSRMTAIISPVKR